MIFRLQDKKLLFQIYVILGVILAAFSVLIILIVPFVLRHSFTEETYARLEDQQEYIIKYPNQINFEGDGEVKPQRSPFPFMGPPDENSDPPIFPPPLDEKSTHGQPFFRVVEHFFITKDGDVQKRIGREENYEEFLEEIIKNIKNQKLKTKEYQVKINEKIYFYVISMVNINGDDEYLVSYLLGEYRDNLVQDVFNNFIKIIGIILLISWVASLFLAMYFTKPLIRLQEQVRDIVKKDWDIPISIDRGDEIGQLAETINWMRKKLVEHNKKQQNFLQQVSHELKTPVMVINSYIQSIKEGIFPQGDIKSSLKIIEEQTERIDNRVQFLLGYTKYEYFSNQQLKQTEFDLHDLITKTASNYIWKNDSINWEFDLEHLVVKGDKEKISICLENLFDNQIRYAKKTIRIKLKKTKVDEENSKDDYSFNLKVWNDGPEINKDIMQNIFKKYEKGYDNGNTGLGLAIVKLLIELHHGLIWVNNEENGVAFYIKV